MPISPARAAADNLFAPFGAFTANVEVRAISFPARGGHGCRQGIGRMLPRGAVVGDVSGGDGLVGWAESDHSGAHSSIAHFVTRALEPTIPGMDKGEEGDRSFSKVDTTRGKLLGNEPAATLFVIGDSERVQPSNKTGIGTEISRALHDTHPVIKGAANA